jgi:hypothetical protein
MADLEQDPDSPEAKIEKASEHLQVSKDHKERADELAKEARDEISDQINRALDDDKKLVKVESKYEVGPPHVVVTVLDKSVQEAIEETVSDDAEVGPLYGQKFAIGENIPAQDLSDRERIQNIRGIISDIEDDFEEGAPIDEVVTHAAMVGLEPDKAKHEIEKLKQKGEVYEPRTDHLRTT